MTFYKHTIVDNEGTMRTVATEHDAETTMRHLNALQDSERSAYEHYAINNPDYANMLHGCKAVIMTATTTAIGY